MYSCVRTHVWQCHASMFTFICNAPDENHDSYTPKVSPDTIMGLEPALSACTRLRAHDDRPTESNNKTCLMTERGLKRPDRG